MHITAVKNRPVAATGFLKGKRQANHLADHHEEVDEADSLPMVFPCQSRFLLDICMTIGGSSEMYNRSGGKERRKKRLRRRRKLGRQSEIRLGNSPDMERFRFHPSELSSHYPVDETHSIISDIA